LVGNIIKEEFVRAIKGLMKKKTDCKKSRAINQDNNLRAMLLT
jgi:hypothetical protein